MGRMAHRFILWFLAVLTACGMGTRVTAEGAGSPDPLPGSLPMSEAQTESEVHLSYPQLTADDIVRLDGGDAELIYDDEGRVTFIRGRYSPDKVLNHEDAVESLNYVATLLGLTRGALFFCVYGGVDRTTGYTYYLFLQRDGDVTVVNASIKVYVDPDGYTAALSCSFNPATGVREETAGHISPDEAEQIVREAYPGRSLTVYSDATTQAGVMEDGRNIHVWEVFTNNPDMNKGGSDLPYLQHFVSYSGQYLLNLPCSTIHDPLREKDDGLERQANAMFEGYEKMTWQGNVTLHDGSKTRLEVPVAKSLKDGRFYLMDLDRKMLVADYTQFIYGTGEMVISSSDTNGGWKDRELLAMYNIGRVYDYFVDHGIYSVDGSGIPLAILSGMCEADGTPIDNAFFMGFNDGFGIFAISDINNSVECLDVMGHEYTHGITSYSMGGSAYVNDLGAINEAYSDIMGNLCELTYSLNERSMQAGRTSKPFEITGTSLYGSTDDPDPAEPDWRIGEMSGRALRDMSDPIRFRQPAFAGDAYYCLSTQHSNYLGNDYGGVHENSSLLGNIAWVMNEHGMTYEQQYSLWMTAMNMMTPKSDYDDILQALIFARKTYGWEDEVDTWLTEAFAERGLLENARSHSGTWDGVTFAEYNAELLQVPDAPGLDQTKPESAGKQEEGQPESADPPKDSLQELLSGGDAEGKSGDPGETGTGEISETKETGTGEISETKETGTGEINETKDTGDLSDVLSDFLTGIAGASADLSDFLTGGASPESDSPDTIASRHRDWLEGVGLDADGRITREGFGRIDFDIAKEDQEILVGAVVVEPYTYATLAVNCPDEEGHVSFLLPEGIYWVSLCVSYGGPNQTDYWPYTKAGGYEKMGNFTVFGQVEVKAGQSTPLPLADVS